MRQELIILDENEIATSREREEVKPAMTNGEVKSAMKKSRREIKYLLSYAEYLVIRSRISLLLDYDKHVGENGYFVSSIYFDDIRETAYREKVDGVFDRRKYRIRTYNKNQGFIRLECKEKYNRYISKQSARINEDICESLLNGDFSILHDNNDKVLKQFYFTAKETGLRSVICVDYHREAFVYPASNLRITFDINLKASFEDELSIPIYQNNNVIMEIKYDDFMPEFIRAVIPHETAKALSISKYRMCMSVAKALHS